MLPKATKYRAFKTAEEIAASTSQLDGSQAIELRDPRSDPTRLIKPSHELISDYGYHSELKPHEQQIIMNLHKAKIIHNPKLVKLKAQHKVRHQTEPPTNLLTPELELKFTTESTHFNKCAEIFFYRHISDFNNLISSAMKKFLITQWSRLENKQDDCRFQMITMLLRDQPCVGEVEVEIVQTNDDFNKETYLICQDTFPLLNCYSAEDLKFYCNLKGSRGETNPEAVDDVAVSAEVLAKLFTDSEQFSVRFENREDLRGKLCSEFRDLLPMKPVSMEEALEEVVRTSLYMSFDWSNLNNFVKGSLNLADDFRALQSEAIMQRLFSKFRKGSGVNEVTQVYKLSKEVHSFTMSVRQSNAYFTIDKDLTIVPVNISIKLEYQTKFGAERMTRDELLKEWCMQKFNDGSVTLRYRIDAAALKIISITKINLEEIEKELLENYNTSASSLLVKLINIFCCTQRLPANSYMMQAKNEESCKKLNIYMSSDGGKSLTDEPWEIASDFTRKWLQIDPSTPTFIHVNHNFPPCCFPISRKRQLSYLPRPKVAKKPKLIAGSSKKTGSPKALPKNPTQLNNTATLKKQLNKRKRKGKKRKMSVKKKPVE